MSRRKPVAPRPPRKPEISKVCGMTEIHVHLGMFDFGINVCIGTHEQFEKYVRYKLELPDFEEDRATKAHGPRGRYIYRIGYCPIVWIPRFPKKPREYATLAHESLHAAYRLMAWANIPINEDTEEVVTHATAFVVTSVLEARKR